MTLHPEISVSEPGADPNEILSPAARGIFWGIFYALGAPFIIILSFNCIKWLIDDHSLGAILFLGYPFAIIGLFLTSMFMRANRMRRRYAIAQITILMVWIPFVAIFAGSAMQLSARNSGDDRTDFWVQSALVLPLTLLAGIVPVAEFRRRRGKTSPTLGSWDQPEYLTAIWVFFGAVVLGSVLLFYTATHR